MTRKRFALKYQQHIAALICYVLVSMLLLVFSTGGFVLDFKNAGFTALSSIQVGFIKVADFVSHSITAVK